MTSIQDFIARAKGGFARPNKFKVRLTVPTIVGGSGVQEEFFISNASLPASTVTAVQVPFMGRMIPFPADRPQESLVLTIQNDTDFAVRNMFERWLNAQNSHLGNNQASANYKDLVSTVEIVQLDRNNDTILKTYKFIQAFPTNISQIDLDWQNNDSIELFSVVFDYATWTSDTTS